MLSWKSHKDLSFKAGSSQNRTLHNIERTEQISFWHAHFSPLICAHQNILPIMIMQITVEYMSISQRNFEQLSRLILSKNNLQYIYIYIHMPVNHFSMISFILPEKTIKPTVFLCFRYKRNHWHKEVISIKVFEWW